MHANLEYRKLIHRIASKEISLFFSSPIAYLFLAAFAGITLFTFFWGEAFFARNLADIRPMFEAMPILLIFLSSALTMRLWSEEKRTGTLEHTFTQPIPIWYFVMGKFLACLVLLSIALTITLPLPLTVSLLGNLDWGPVTAGYLAAFFLGAAYLSIGLFISARSENQIVSLISSCFLCGFFYLLGSPALTDFFGNAVGEYLRLMGTGSRFASITRGVVDLKDFYYYFSIFVTFLTLNTLSLEKFRWSNSSPKPYHKNWKIICSLLILNVLAGNLWIGQLNALRFDLTEEKQYSISEATKNHLEQLREPLLIRGYFSAKTHPLLSPLLPRLRDLIREYEVIGKGKVKAEFIDPANNPELEKEANENYGIQAVPFQVADRYQSSIVSSYFNILIQYGNEYQTLGFRDLIEIKDSNRSDVNVQLRNPEYDLTQAIKKVLHNYQSGGGLFDVIQEKIAFNAYISEESTLPEQLKEYKKSIEECLQEMKKEAKEKFAINFIDPNGDNGKVAKEIEEKFGFKAMTNGLLSQDFFYFYLTLSKGEQVIPLPIEDLSPKNFKRNLESGIKRFAPGFTKTIALASPAPSTNHTQYSPSVPQYSLLENFLQTELNVKKEEIDDGKISGEADFLLLLSPKDLNEKQLFAIDQFLMQGGTVLIATSPYALSWGLGDLRLEPQNNGLKEWLQNYGIEVEEKVILDKQNAAFPIPVERNVGGFRFQELRMLDYPYFVDVRGKGLNKDNPITSNLPQTTLTWASPILIDQEKNSNRKIIKLLHSSEKSQLSSSTDVMPRINKNDPEEFLSTEEEKSNIIGLICEGSFDSYFAGKPSPLSFQVKEEKESKENHLEEISTVMERSPNSSRIILFSSNDFLSDQIVQTLGSSDGKNYLNTLQLISNSIDWSLEDQGLLSIRSRSNFNRTLLPMEKNEKLFWEYLNYGLAIFALFLIATVQKKLKKNKDHKYKQLFA